ncbi:MAG TPA: hypothetical protein VJU84_14410 [Pyrinomonadaceae bacterium]|nr:hypothetical protein [Pyrinomonadaceae bacterium]
MRDFKEDHQTIKQFLLGQLSDDEARNVEDRIFAEADFAEEVGIVEAELIAEYFQGNLVSEVRALFETKYLNKKANETTFDYEKLFSEFIHSRSKANLSSPALKRQSGDSELSNTQIGSPPVLLKSSRQGLGPWIEYVFRGHRHFAYAVVLIGFLLSVTVVLYLVGDRIVRPRLLLEAKRQAIEAQLARLNAPGAGRPEKVLVTIKLQPAERNRGAMARVAADRTTPDALLEFRLSLTEAKSQNYRAVFFDDQHKELFSISNLSAQGTPNDPEISFVVPAVYLNTGDYQIGLSVSNDNKGYDEVNSYAVRVVSGS